MKFPSTSVAGSAPSGNSFAFTYPGVCGSRVGAFGRSFFWAIAIGVQRDAKTVIEASRRTTPLDLRFTKINLLRLFRCVVFLLLIGRRVIFVNRVLSRRPLHLDRDVQAGLVHVVILAIGLKSLCQYLNSQFPI